MEDEQFEKFLKYFDARIEELIFHVIAGNTLNALCTTSLDPKNKSDDRTLLNQIAQKYEFICAELEKSRRALAEEEKSPKT